jgi:hypothetical protein
MLFEKEKVNFNSEELKMNFSDDELINRKYVSGEVRIVTEQARYPLDTIKTMIDSGKYKLNPDFQRRHRWSNEKKSRLMESFIMNVPIPPIFLYENEFSHYEVMDGLQRLTAIYDYYNDSYKLEGLKLWGELNGRSYSELPEKVKRGIDRRYISSIILLQESAKSDEEAQKMKQLVFERINSGGVKLEPQETRNALYDGKMNRLCIDLSENKYLCSFLKIPVPNAENKNERDENENYRKMVDVEYVLRFFAMRQLEGYTGRKLNDFLDAYLIKANDFDDKLLKKLRCLYEDTLEFAYKVFGEKAFYMFRKKEDINKEIINEKIKWNWYSKTTTTVYDPMMQVLSELLPYKEILINNRDKIRDEIKDFYKNNYHLFGGRNTNKSDIEKRIKEFKKFFEGFIKG